MSEFAKGNIRKKAKGGKQMANKCFTMEAKNFKNKLNESGVSLELFNELRKMWHELSVGGQAEVTDMLTKPSETPEIALDNLKNTANSDVEIVGIIFKHGENDYGLWEGFHFSQEEVEELSKMFAEHETEGCSIRGTKQEIADDFADNYDYEK